MTSMIAKFGADSGIEVCFCLFSIYIYYFTSSLRVFRDTVTKQRGGFYHVSVVS